MAWTQFGNPEFGEWTVQNDLRAQQSENGGWHAAQTFRITKATLDDSTFQSEFSGGRPYLELNPHGNPYFSFLGLEYIPTIQDVRGGFLDITVRFAGIFATFGDGARQDPIETYRLRGELSERSILEHDKVIALGLADRLLLAGLYDGLYFWDGINDVLATRVLDGSTGQEILVENIVQPTAGDALAFAKLIVEGRRTYPHPNFVWEARWQDREPLPADDLNTLGQIDTPRGDPPEPNGGRNWMLTYCDQDTDGDLFNLAMDWTLSERGGWNTDIHQD